MRIYLNGKEEEIGESATVQALLEHFALNKGRVAVEVNQELVTRKEWALYKLKAQDRIEVVSFVGGG